MSVGELLMTFNEKAAAQTDRARQILVGIIGVQFDIRNMHHCTLEDRARGTVRAAGTRRIYTLHFGHCFRGEIVLGDLVYQLPIEREHGAEQPVAQPDYAFDYCVEDRLDIGGRTRNDLEHFGGGGLLVEQFGEFTFARVKLLEEAHVLDRDHRLVREGLHELDLRGSEWLHLASAAPDDSDWHAVADDGDAQIRSIRRATLYDLQRLRVIIRIR